MQSGGWPYSEIGRDSSKAPSLRVAVLRTTVMCMVKVHVYTHSAPRPSPLPVLITYGTKSCKHSYSSSLIAG